MDASAASALAAAAGFSLPSGLAPALVELERLRAKVARLQRENATLTFQNELLQWNAENGRVSFAPNAREPDGSTWAQRYNEVVVDRDDFLGEADYWYGRWAAVTRCPRHRDAPYVRPAERR